MLPFALTLALASAEGGAPPVILEEQESDTTTAPSMLAHEAKGWGVGVILGLPTGLSAAYHTDGRVFYDLALAWSFERGTLATHGDLLVTLAELRTDDVADMSFPVWIGLGPRIRLGDTLDTPGSDMLTLGARVPVGMSFIHDGVPIEAFLEFAPGIGLYPSTAPTFDVAIGGRYYFGAKARAAGSVAAR
jgi:hypothetical protein